MQIKYVFVFGGLFLYNLSFARSLEEIKRSKEFRVCYAPTVGITELDPPDCKKNCKVVGPAPSEVDAYISNLDKNIKIIPKIITWDEQFFNDAGKTETDAEYVPMYLKSGQCDVYPNHLTKVPWREKKMNFAILFNSRMAVLIHKDHKKKWKNLSDMKGLNIAIEKNTSFYTYVKEQNDTILKSNPIKIVEMDSFDGLTAVSNKKMDATILDADSALYSIKQKAPSLIAVFAIGNIDSLGWGIRIEDKDLHESVQKFFDEQKKSATSKLSQIWMNYFEMNLIEFNKLITGM